MSTIRRMVRSATREKEREFRKSNKIIKFFEMIENQNISDDLSL